MSKQLGNYELGGDFDNSDQLKMDFTNNAEILDDLKKKLIELEDGVDVLKEELGKLIKNNSTHSRKFCIDSGYFSLLKADLSCIKENSLLKSLSSRDLDLLMKEIEGLENDLANC